MPVLAFLLLVLVSLLEEYDEELVLLGDESSYDWRELLVWAFVTVLCDTSRVVLSAFWRRLSLLAVACSLEELIREFRVSVVADVLLSRPEMLLRLLSVPLLTRRDVLVRDDAIAPVRVWLVVVALSML